MGIRVMRKKELKAIGFTDYQASEMIRIIKRQLANANRPLYSNPRISFVPVVEVENYLFGVSGTIAESDDAVAEIKERLIDLPELKSSLGSEHIAKEIIRQAQKIMADRGCEFYRHSRHWNVPREAINQILFRNQKGEA